MMLATTLIVTATLLTSGRAGGDSNLKNVCAVPSRNAKIVPLWDEDLYSDVVIDRIKMFGEKGTDPRTTPFLEMPRQPFTVAEMAERKVQPCVGSPKKLCYSASGTVVGDPAFQLPMDGRGNHGRLYSDTLANTAHLYDFVMLGDGSIYVNRTHLTDLMIETAIRIFTNLSYRDVMVNSSQRRSIDFSLGNGLPNPANADNRVQVAYYAFTPDEQKAASNQDNFYVASGIAVFINAKADRPLGVEYYACHDDLSQPCDISATKSPTAVYSSTGTRLKWRTHQSFSKRVASAGEMFIYGGTIGYISNGSGHFLPKVSQTERARQRLRNMGMPDEALPTVSDHDNTPRCQNLPSGFTCSQWWTN